MEDTYDWEILMAVFMGLIIAWAFLDHVWHLFKCKRTRRPRGERFK